MRPDATMFTLSAVVAKSAVSGYHYLPVEPAVAKQLLEASHRRVLVTVGGHTFRRALGVWSDVEGAAVIFGQDALRQTGLRLGDKATFAITTDPSPDVWELPEELAAWLEQDEHAAKMWAALTPGYQRSLCYYVTSAKRAETRFARAESLVQKMKTGQLRGPHNRLGR